jgi:hypothetical protein
MFMCDKRNDFTIIVIQHLIEGATRYVDAHIKTHVGGRGSRAIWPRLLA